MLIEASIWHTNGFPCGQFHSDSLHYVGFHNALRFTSKTLLVIVKYQSSHFVYLNMHTIINLWKFELNWSSKLWDNNERKKHPFHTKLCAFRCLISRPQNLILSLEINSWKISSFTKTTLLQREPFSHNVLYYQQLSITRYIVSFYAKNYFE